MCPARPITLVTECLVSETSKNTHAIHPPLGRHYRLLASPGPIAPDLSAFDLSLECTEGIYAAVWVPGHSPQMQKAAKRPKTGFQAPPLPPHPHAKYARKRLARIRQLLAIPGQSWPV